MARTPNEPLKANHSEECLSPPMGPRLARVVVTPRLLKQRESFPCPHLRHSKPSMHANKRHPWRCDVDGVTYTRLIEAQFIDRR